MKKTQHRIASATLFIFASLFVASAWALSPRAEADRLQLQAKAALDAKDYAQAAESLAKAEKLGVKLPDSFYFHYGRALAGTGDFDQAQAMLDRYVDQAGSKGKFYREALDEMNHVDAARKEKAAEADRKARAEEERRKDEENKFRDCARKASDIGGHMDDFNRRRDLAEARNSMGQLSYQEYAALKKEDKQLSGDVDSFKRRCGGPWSLPDDFKQRVCDAIPSHWCQG